MGAGWAKGRANMRYVVLESYPGNDYADSPATYTFPQRYRKHFDPLAQGEPIFAVIYEPRANGGRMAYVGWATITAPPRPKDGGGASGTWWEVSYTDGIHEFARVVPREVDGEPVEGWLRALPRGRERNIATLGRAVRDLDDDDLRRILALVDDDVARQVGGLVAPAAAPALAPLVAEERLRQAVTRVQRDARFREDVLMAYDYRCAVSGL